MEPRFVDECSQESTASSSDDENHHQTVNISLNINVPAGSQGAPLIIGLGDLLGFEKHSTSYKNVVFPSDVSSSNSCSCTLTRQSSDNEIVKNLDKIDVPVHDSVPPTTPVSSKKNSFNLLNTHESSSAEDSFSEDDNDKFVEYFEKELLKRLLVNPKNSTGDTKKSKDVSSSRPTCSSGDFGVVTINDECSGIGVAYQVAPDVSGNVVELNQDEVFSENLQEPEARKSGVVDEEGNKTKSNNSRVETSHLYSKSDCNNVSGANIYERGNSAFQQVYEKRKRRQADFSDTEAVPDESSDSERRKNKKMKLETKPEIAEEGTSFLSRLGSIFSIRLPSKILESFWPNFK